MTASAEHQAEIGAGEVENSSLLLYAPCRVSLTSKHVHDQEAGAMFAIGNTWHKVKDHSDVPCRCKHAFGFITRLPLQEFLPFCVAQQEPMCQDQP